jgi:hypothetical protein
MPMPEPIPGLYWSPSQGVIIEGGDGARYLLLHPEDGRDIGDDLPADAQPLVPVPQAGKLPVISGRVTLTRNEVRFTQHPETHEWCLVGPDTMLPVGEGIEVEKFTSAEHTVVVVGPHVAERVVRHADGAIVRYVLAEIDRGGAGA